MSKARKTLAALVADDAPDAVPEEAGAPEEWTEPEVAEPRRYVEVTLEELAVVAMAIAEGRHVESIRCVADYMGGRRVRLSDIRDGVCRHRVVEPAETYVVPEIITEPEGPTAEAGIGLTVPGPVEAEAEAEATEGTGEEPEPVADAPAEDEEKDEGAELFE